MKDDASMGWARYAHSMRIFVINSGLFYIRPTLASLELMIRITDRLNTENGWDQAIFNEVQFAQVCPTAEDKSKCDVVTLCVKWRHFTDGTCRLSAPIVSCLCHSSSKD